MDKPTSEILRTLLRYDEGTGRLYWRERPVSAFSDGAYPAQRAAAIWNAKHAGKEAMTAVGERGRRVGRLFGRNHLAHRIIWAMVHDEWPECIDHINGDSSDNSLSNLRAADHRINGQNTRRPVSNTSGRVGVSRIKAGGWAAYIGHGLDRRRLGTFGSLEDASRARAAAEREHGYHPNHGRAA